MPRRTVGDKNVSSRKEQNRINQRAFRERKRRELQEMRETLACMKASEMCESQSQEHNLDHASVGKNSCQQRMMECHGDTRPAADPSDIATPSLVASTSSDRDDESKGPSFAPFEGTSGIDQRHTKSTSGTSPADMSALDRGGEKILSLDAENASACGEDASGSNQAQTRLVDPREGEVESESVFCLHDSAALRANRSVVAKAVRTHPDLHPAGGSAADEPSIRAKMEGIEDAQMQITQFMHTVMEGRQAQADRRTDTPLSTPGTSNIVTSTTGQETGGAEFLSGNGALPCATTDPTILQERQRLTQQIQPSCADIIKLAARSRWGTVKADGDGLRKHPRHRRRILFIRNIQSHDCDPGDVMLAVNRALAHASARASVRLIRMRYTNKGDLTGVMSEDACADELFDLGPSVMAAVRRLDPAVVCMAKKEELLRLRVYNMSVKCYVTEGASGVITREV